MRSAERRCALIACALLVVTGAAVASQEIAPVHRTRHAMGTMFDIVVYHASQATAERAIARAMAEIVRLDEVMSNFKENSELSRLNREGRHGFTAVDSSLFDVIRQSIEFSRVSDGRFDITVAPLFRLWKEAHAEGREPTDAERSAAKACVGADKLETREPNRVRFLRACVELDLGGIGKGYVVDRAISILREEGVEHALVNAGGSSITAIGAPPGRSGWPVDVGGEGPGGTTILLSGQSISTSQQSLVSHAFAASTFGHIIDPRAGAPLPESHAVTVTAPNATAADALSTALLMYSFADARALFERLPGVSAIWTSPAGQHAHLP